MKRFVLAAVLAVLAFPVSANASTVFDGRNFGVAGTECVWSCSSTQNGAPYQPNIAPWSAVQFEKPGGEGLGNGYSVVTSPVRTAGAGESAKIHIRSDATLTGERIQFRAYQVGAPGVDGKDYWFAFSHQFPASTPVTQFTSLMDVGTKFNTNCAGSASYGGSNGAGVPEFYLYNNAVRDTSESAAAFDARISNPADPHWLWRIKLAGGTGTNTGAGYNCNFRYFDLPLHTIPTDKWIDGLWHFHYSAVAGQALTEFWYRVAPSATWTQVTLDTKPNLVRTTANDAAIDFHYGVYKPEEFAPNITVIKSGAVITTTRQEAEDLAFGAGSPPPPPPPPPPATCDTGSITDCRAQIASLKQQLADMTASRDASNAKLTSVQSWFSSAPSFLVR